MMAWLMSKWEIASAASEPQKTEKIDLVGKIVTSTGKKHIFER